MKPLLFVLGVCLAGLAWAPQAARADATAKQTWVSGVGDDANALPDPALVAADPNDPAVVNYIPCKNTGPCKTFAGAIAATSDGGEINCLDAGGFGAVTITKSVAIVCKGRLGGVLTANPANGVTVNLPNPTDWVVLDGLDIEGVGTAPNGVRMLGSGTLILRNSVIRGFAQYGVVMTGAAGASMLIEDTVITKTATGGLQYGNTTNLINFVQLNRVTLYNNGAAGVKLGPGGSLFISNSTILGSTASIDNSAGGTTTSFANNVLVPTPPVTTTPLR